MPAPALFAGAIKDGTGRHRSRKSANGSADPKQRAHSAVRVCSADYSKLGGHAADEYNPANIAGAHMLRAMALHL